METKKHLAPDSVVVVELPDGTRTLAMDKDGEFFTFGQSEPLSKSQITFVSDDTFTIDDILSLGDERDRYIDGPMFDHPMMMGMDMMMGPRLSEELEFALFMRCYIPVFLIPDDELQPLIEKTDGARFRLQWELDYILDSLFELAATGRKLDINDSRRLSEKPLVNWFSASELNVKPLPESVAPLLERARADAMIEQLSNVAGLMRIPKSQPSDIATYSDLELVCLLSFHPLGNYTQINEPDDAKTLDSLLADVRDWRKAQEDLFYDALKPASKPSLSM